MSTPEHDAEQLKQIRLKRSAVRTAQAAVDEAKEVLKDAKDDLEAAYELLLGTIDDDQMSLALAKDETAG